MSKKNRYRGPHRTCGGEPAGGAGDPRRPPDRLGSRTRFPSHGVERVGGDSLREDHYLRRACRKGREGEGGTRGRGGGIPEPLARNRSLSPRGGGRR